MSILEIFKPKPKPTAPESVTGDGDVWCIEEYGNPLRSLCGDALRAYGSVPACEVPDEMTCKQCLRIERMIEKAKKGEL